MIQPQDVFNREYDATTAALDVWAATLADVASIEREKTPTYWRLSMRPSEPNACAVELMLSRNQTYDLELANVALTNEPVLDFSLFRQLLDAIVGGSVISRSWSAQATGTELMREAVVPLADGHDWLIRRILHAGTAPTELSALASDHVFLPYRRA